MEPAWSSVDFTVDISDSYERKRAAIAAYASVFQGDQARLVERVTPKDRYYGSLLGVRYAEPFQARSPLVVSDPTGVRESTVRVIGAKALPALRIHFFPGGSCK